MDAMLFTEAAAMNIPGVDNVAVTRIDRGRLGDTQSHHYTNGDTEQPRHTLAPSVAQLALVSSNIALDIALRTRCDHHYIMTASVMPL